jgi:toxin ParE1/3/4
MKLIIYKIRYLPIAQEDLQDIVLYFLYNLKSPQAAINFIEAFNKSVSRLKKYPYAYKLYQPQYPIESEYRFLTVKNYLVFYIVTENIVEIHRIIYAKMDLGKIIE